jgi:uncharacterized coiled-coil DUF342 family protein
MTDEPLVPWREIAAQSIDHTEALEAERDGFRAEVGLLLLSVKTFEVERDELRAENERLRAALREIAEHGTERDALRVEIERLRANLRDYRERHPCSHQVMCWADEYASRALDRDKCRYD